MSSIFDRLINNMRLGDDDYDEDDEDLFDEEDDEEEDYVPPVKKARPARRPIRPITEEEEERVEEPAPVRSRTAAPARQAAATGNVVPMRPKTPVRSSGRGMEVCMIKPASVNDSREICETLLSGRAVVINLEGLHIETAQRIIDFTSGACYSMGGNLQMISKYIFIVTPKSVELSGDFQDIQDMMMLGEDAMSRQPKGLSF